MKIVEYLFIRHGQTDWNNIQKVMGRQPVSLNEKGKHQAKELAKYLKGLEIEVVATSPVKRAVETAKAIVSACPDSKLIVDEGLTEIDYGDWVNLTFVELTKRYPQVWQDYHNNPRKMTIPGGESLAAAQERTVDSIIKLRKKYPEGRIALVSHADVIKLAVIGMLKWPINMFKTFSMDNGAVILLREHPLLGVRMVWYNALNGIGKEIRDGN